MEDFHYCDIFSDCYRCPVPFCPYEKLEGWDREPVEVEEEFEEEEDQDDGW